MRKIFLCFIFLIILSGFLYSESLCNFSYFRLNNSISNDQKNAKTIKLLRDHNEYAAFWISSTNLYYRIFKSDFSEKQAETTISMAYPIDTTMDYSITALQNGGFAIAYINSGSVYLTIFNIQNEIIIDSQKVSSGTENMNNVSICAYLDRYIGILWNSDSGSAIRYRRYEIDGYEVTNGVQYLNTANPSPMTALKILNCDDGFIIFWIDNSNNLKMKMFKNGGTLGLSEVNILNDANINKVDVKIKGNFIFIAAVDELLKRLKIYIYKININSAPTLLSTKEITELSLNTDNITKLFISNIKNGLNIFFENNNFASDSQKGVFGFHTELDSLNNIVKVYNYFNISKCFKSNSYTSNDQKLTDVLSDNNYIYVTYSSDDQENNSTTDIYTAIYSYSLEPDIWLRFDDSSDLIKFTTESSYPGSLSITPDSISGFLQDNSLYWSMTSSSNNETAITYDLVSDGRNIQITGDTLFNFSFKSDSNNCDYFGIKFIFQDNYKNYYVYKYNPINNLNDNTIVMKKRSNINQGKWMIWNGSLTFNYMDHVGQPMPDIPVSLVKIVVFSHNPINSKLYLDNLMLFNISETSIGNTPDIPDLKVYYSGLEIDENKPVKPDENITLWAHVNDSETIAASMNNCSFSIRKNGSSTWDIIDHEPAVFDDINAPISTLRWKYEFTIPDPGADTLYDIYFYYEDEDHLSNEKTILKAFKVSNTGYYLTISGIETYVGTERRDDPLIPVDPGETITIFARLSDSSISAMSDIESLCYFKWKKHGETTWSYIPGATTQVAGVCPDTSDNTIGILTTFTLSSDIQYGSYDIYFYAEDTLGITSEKSEDSQISINVITDKGRFQYIDIEGAKCGIYYKNSTIHTSNSYFKNCETAIKLEGNSKPVIRYNKFKNSFVNIDSSLSTVATVDAIYNWFGGNESVDTTKFNDSYNKIKYKPWAYWSGKNAIIDGTITTDEIWDNSSWPKLSDGSYPATVVLDTIEVSINASLTINSDSFIKFRPDTGLIVKGNLDIQGSSTNPVVFTSLNNDSKEIFFESNSAPEKDDFNGLQFIETLTSNAHTFNISNLKLDHSNGIKIINNGTADINSIKEYSIGFDNIYLSNIEDNGIYFNGVSFDDTNTNNSLISNIEINNCNNNGILAEHSRIPAIDSLKISNCKNGLKLNSSNMFKRNILGEVVSLYNFDIRNIFEYGIISSEFTNIYSFLDGTIENTTENSIEMLELNLENNIEFDNINIYYSKNGLNIKNNSSKNIIIKDSIISNSSENGSRIENSSADITYDNVKLKENTLNGIECLSQTDIKNSEISDNGIGIYSNLNINVNIDSNNIYNNIGNGIQCDASNGVISNNDIKENKGSGIKLKGLNSGISPYSPKIEDNNIISNIGSGIDVDQCCLRSENNTLEKNSNGIYCNNVLKDNINNYDPYIKKNNINDNKQNGVLLENTKMENISDNKFIGNYDCGIQSNNSAIISLDSNEIKLSNSGIISNGIYSGEPSQIWTDNILNELTDNIYSLFNSKNITIKSSNSANKISLNMFDIASAFFIDSSSNIEISDHIIIGALENGVFLDNSSADIHDNTLKLNGVGISVNSSISVNIYDNFINKNLFAGIISSNSSFSSNSIYNNIITENTTVGMNFKDGSSVDNDALQNNDIYDNGKGKIWNDEISWKWDKQDSGLLADSTINDSLFYTENNEVYGYLCGENGLFLESFENGQVYKSIVSESINLGGTDQKDINFKAMVKKGNDIYIIGTNSGKDNIYRYNGTYIEKLYVSPDPAPIGDKIRDIAVSPSKKLYICINSSSSGKIYKSDDGINWTLELSYGNAITSLTIPTETKAFFITDSASRIYGYNLGTGTVLATDIHNISGASILNKIRHFNTNVIIAVGGNTAGYAAVARSYNGGNDWTLGNVANAKELYDVSGLISGRCVAVGKNGTIIKGEPVIGDKPLISEFHPNIYKVGPGWKFKVYWEVESSTSVTVNIKRIAEDNTIYNFPGPYSQNGSLGTTLNSAISPPPHYPYTYTFVITAINATGSSNRKFTMTVDEKFMTDIYVSETKTSSFEVEEGTIDYPLHKITDAVIPLISGGNIFITGGNYSGALVFNAKSAKLKASYDLDFMVQDFSSNKSVINSPTNSYSLKFQNSSSNSEVDMIEFNKSGIYVLNSLNCIIKNSYIHNNSAQNGAGIKSSSANGLNIINCDIKSNSATNSDGGGIKILNSDGIKIDQCDVSNNSSKYFGGGIYLKDSDNIEISNTLIYNNSVSNAHVDSSKKGGGDVNKGFGGGFYFYNCKGSSKLHHNKISSNSSYLGGGIFDQKSKISYFSNVILSNDCNDSSSYGGRGGGLYLHESDSIIVNNTFAKNQSDSDGPALYYYKFNGDSTRTISNCIFYKNLVEHHSTQTSRDVYCNRVQDPNWPHNRPSKDDLKYCIFKDDDQTGFNVDSNSMTGTDPKFVDETDYELKSNSPAINSGMSTSYDLNQDLAGNYNGSAPDIGGRESNFTLPPAPTDVTAVAVSDTKITIDFTEIPGYKYYVYLNGNQNGPHSYNTTPLTISGLSGNTTYSIEVSRFKAGVEGPKSNPPVSVLTFPTTPVITMGTITDTTAVFSWTPNNESGVTYSYSVEDGGGAEKDSGASITSPHTSLNLSASTSYTLKVKATNSSGTSTGTKTFTTTASVTIVYVNGNTGNDTTGNGSQANPYKTISKAVQSVISDSEIHVSEGMYNETITINSSYIVIIKGGYVNGDWNTRNIKLNVTKIQKNITQPLIFLNGSGNFTLDGLEIAGNLSDRCIKASSNGEYKIKNCFIHNGKRDYGAGLYYNGTNKLFLEHCSISNNSSTDNGGGIYIVGIGITTISYCKIDNNISDDDNDNVGKGAGIYVKNNSGFNIYNCIISNNTSKGDDAGGIYFSGNFTGGNIHHLTIVGNTAGDRCGALRGASNSVQLELKNSIIDSNNTVNPTHVADIALDFVTAGSSFKLTNCKGRYTTDNGDPNDDGYSVTGNSKDDDNTNPKMNGDFTLQAGSPCRNAGDDGSDLGAIPYGVGPAIIGW